MESYVSIPFRHGFVTNLSLIAQELSHNCQESSAKLQRIAETGNQQSYIKLGFYVPKTRSLRRGGGRKPCATGPRRTLCNPLTECSSCLKWLPGIAALGMVIESVETPVADETICSSGDVDCL